MFSCKCLLPCGVLSPQICLASTLWFTVDWAKCSVLENVRWWPSDIGIYSHRKEDNLSGSPKVGQKSGKNVSWVVDCRPRVMVKLGYRIIVSRKCLKECSPLRPALTETHSDWGQSRPISLEIIIWLTSIILWLHDNANKVVAGLPRKLMRKTKSSLPSNVPRWRPTHTFPHTWYIIAKSVRPAVIHPLCCVFCITSSSSLWETYFVVPNCDID